jgi:hypothetical protein
MAQKKGPVACDDRALKANSRILHAEYTAHAFELQVSPAEARWPRISARAENHLSEVEWRIARVGQAIHSGHADRGLVADGLRAAVIRAGLAKHGNWGKKKNARALCGDRVGAEGQAEIARSLREDGSRGATRTPESVAKMVRTRRANGNYKPRSAALARALLDQEVPR